MTTRYSITFISADGKRGGVKVSFDKQTEANDFLEKSYKKLSYGENFYCSDRGILIMKDKLLFAFRGKEEVEDDE